VATPIGNLEDITFRAVRILGEVAVVAAEDTRRAKKLLNHYDIRPGKLVSFFDGNEASRSRELLSHLQSGDDVATISDAGMPGVSDPGQRLIALAWDEGIDVQVLPGPSASLTAAVGSGLRTDALLFLGFPPRTTGARQQLFGQRRGERATWILYESPDRVAATIADLREALGDERQAALARELTKIHEQYVRGTLAELAERVVEQPPRGECTLIVAGALEADEAPVDLEARVRALLAEGLGPKDVAARLVAKTGLPRRQIYQLALSLGRESAR